MTFGPRASSSPLSAIFISTFWITFPTDPGTLSSFVFVVITGLAIAPIVVPVALVAWIVNVVRFQGSVVRIDEDYVWVGRRWARLAALDLSTLGRASNTWPWRAFNPRYLGANPIWTRDSVGVRGVDGGKKYWFSVGTNRRDELVRMLEAAVPVARERATHAIATAPPRLPPPGWHPDPWRQHELRWWDGVQWTEWVRDKPGGTRSEDPPGSLPPPGVAEQTPWPAARRTRCAAARAPRRTGRPSV